MPGNYSLTLYRGDSYNWSFVVWADQAKTQPADLTDVVPAAQIRTAAGGALLIDLACSITLPNIVYVSLSAAFWPLTMPKSAVWDLELTYPNGTITTIVAGKVSITMDVTNTAPEAAPLRAIS